MPADDPQPEATSVAAVVAIDGPAGAGKSTAARMLAKRLGFFLLDTGAIYRCVAVAALESNVAWTEAEAVAARAAAMRIEFRAGQGDDGQRVILDGKDVSERIRMPDISDGASQVSSHAAVRRALLGLQRDIAGHGRCVVEGRDIGSVVLPWAPVKFFLTASPAVRARRRHDELVARGVASDLDKTLAEILERDRRDETREAAPLIQAPDAIPIDTSELSLDEVVARMDTLARSRLGTTI